MHGAAQTANAPPRRTREPRERAPWTSPAPTSRSGHGQEPHERQAEHDEHEARDLLEQELVAEQAGPEQRRSDAERDEERREPERRTGCSRRRRGAPCPAGPARRRSRRRPPTGSPGRAAGRTARGTRGTPRAARRGSRSRSTRNPPGCTRCASDGRGRHGKRRRRGWSHASNRSSSASTRRSSAGIEGSRRSVPPGACGSTPMRSRRRRAPRRRATPSGTSHASRSKPDFGGSASTPAPNWSTSSSLICFSVAPSARRTADDLLHPSRDRGVRLVERRLAASGRRAPPRGRRGSARPRAAVTATPAASARSDGEQRQPRHGASPRASAIPRSNVARLRSMSTAPSIRSPTSLPVRSTKNVSGNPRTPHLPTVEPLPS